MLSRNPSRVYDRARPPGPVGLEDDDPRALFRGAGPPHTVRPVPHPTTITSHSFLVPLLPPSVPMPL